MKKPVSIIPYFLLLIGISGIIIASVYIIPSVLSATTYIYIAGRQRMLAERMVLNIHLINDGKKDVIGNLLQDVKTFNETLSILENGGKIMNRNIAAPSKTTRTKVKYVRAIWQPIRNQLIKIAEEKLSQNEFHQIFNDLHKKIPLLEDASSDIVESAIASNRVKAISGILIFILLFVDLFILFFQFKSRDSYIEKRRGRYRKALEYIGENVIITDINGVIEYVNPAFTDITGYQKNEILGKTTDILKSGMHTESFFEEIRKTIHSKRIWKGIVIIKKKNGNIYYSSNIISPYLDRKGNISHTISAGRDITEDKKREERIVHLNHLLKTTYEINQLIVRERDRNNLLRTVCQILVEEGGFKMAWICNADFKSGEVHPIAWAGFEEGYLKNIQIRCDDTQKGNGPAGTAIKTGKYFICNDVEKEEFFKPWREAAKERGYRSSGAFPFKVNGKIKGAINVYSGEPDAFQDEFIVLLNGMAENIGFALDKMEISEEGIQLKETLIGIESQLQQAIKMEAIGRLVGGIAHDFNNILASIINYSEISLTYELNPDLEKIMQEIKKSAERAKSVTTQLLSFSRDQPVEMKAMNINESIESIGEMLKKLIGEDISLSVLSTPDIHNIKANPSQIEQVIMNLVVNARDALSKGGNILVETSNIVIDDTNRMSHLAVPPGNFVILSVSDNGTGISKENLDKIFEPFFTTKDTGKGTGLGLSIVYGIVKRTDGFIEVASETGKGTSFRIYFPAFLEGISDEVSQKIETKKTVEHGSGCILLVEDDEQVKKSTEMVLEYLGYRVFSAACLEEAVDVFEKHDKTIDMLITDMKMPNGTGLELYREICKKRQDIKALFMSGYTGDINGGLPDGTSFIQKPFTMASLAENVRKILGDI